MTVRDPPPDHHLAGERDWIAAEIARTRGRAAACFHDVTPHTPRRLGCHDAPPLSVSSPTDIRPRTRGPLMVIVSLLCRWRNKGCPSSLRRNRSCAELLGASEAELLPHREPVAIAVRCQRLHPRTHAANDLGQLPSPSLYPP